MEIKFLLIATTLCTEGQLLVNRVPKSGMMTNKLSLLTNLQRYERVRLSCSVRNQLSLWLYEFVPETYRLDDRIDRKAFLEAFKGSPLLSTPVLSNVYSYNICLNSYTVSFILEWTKLV